MADQRIIETARQYIKLIPENFGLKKAYLFGSFAKGDAREESDIDIARVFGKYARFFRYAADINEAQKKYRSAH